MELFDKYIVEDGTLQLSRVTFHKELVKDKTKVRGGGMFIRDAKTIIFHGSSFDFGPANDDEIRKCILDKKVFWGFYKNISDEFKFKLNTGSEILDIN